MKASEALQTALRRHTAFPDIYQVPAGQQQEALMCLNRALALVFVDGPAERKRTWVRQRIGETSQATGISLAPGETVCSNASAFRSDERYQTVVIDGDPTYNEILGDDTVAYPYGGTATANTATIYVDAMPFFDFSVERLVGPVEVHLSTGDRFELARDDSGLIAQRFSQAGFNPRYAGYATPYLIRRFTNIRPLTYQVRPIGNSRNTDGDAAFLIRVDPIPTEIMTLSVQVEQEPELIKLEALLDGTATLPIPDMRAVLFLIPLLEEELCRSSLSTASDTTKQQVANAASEARLHVMRQHQFSAPPVCELGARGGF